jgi:hypothetical protein
VEIRRGRVRWSDELPSPEELSLDPAPAPPPPQSRRNESSEETPQPRPDESSEESPGRCPDPRRSDESSNESPTGRARATGRSDDSSNESPTRSSGVDGADIAEILLVDRWLSRNAGRLRVHAVEGELMSALPRIVAGATPRSR